MIAIEKLIVALKFEWVVISLNLAKISDARTNREQVIVPHLKMNEWMNELEAATDGGRGKINEFFIASCQLFKEDFEI